MSMDAVGMDAVGEEGVGEDRSISLARANVLALVVVPLAALAVLATYVLMHGIRPLGGGWERVTEPLVSIPILLASVVVHEGLHALGFLAAGAPRASLRFGVQTRTLTPYAGCIVPLSARGYRFSAALPALVLGVLPMLWSWAAGSADLAIVAAWMLAFAGGDLMILWITRDLPPRTLLIDHPDRAGCRIVPG